MKLNSKWLFLPLLSLAIFNIVNIGEKSAYATTSDETSLTAYINKDNPVKLTDVSSGQVVSDYWLVSDIKNLHLDINFSDADKTGKYIEIKLPLGMKLDSTIDGYVNGTTIVSVDKTQFAKKQIASVNRADAYTPNCGTVKFNVSDNVKSLSLDVWVSVDENLWDTAEGSATTFDNEYAIEVSIGSSSNKISKKLDNVFVNGRTWDTYYDSNVPSYIQVDDRVLIRNELTMDYVQKKYTRLYKKITSKMDIPYVVKTVNGVATKKYATVLEVNVQDGGKYEIKDNQIFITYENMWLKYADYDVYFYFDSTIFKENDVVNYSYGDFYVENYFSGKSTKLLGMTNNTVTVGPKNEKVLIYADTVGAFNSKNETVVNHFGRFSIFNYGGLSSDKRLTFDFPYGSASGVGITTIRIPTNEAAQNMTVDYVLWQKGTNNLYSGKITIDKPKTSYYSGYLLTVSDLKKSLGLDNVKGLYLKQIKYVFGRIPYNYVSGIRSSELSPSSSGNIWGNMFNDTQPETFYRSTMTMESLSSSGAVTESINTYQNVIVVDAGKAPAYVERFGYYDINNQPISEISSGSKILIKGNFSMAPYPYTNSGYMDKPIVMIKVPNGVAIDKAYTRFTSSSDTSKNLDFKILNELNPRKLSNGEFVYDIAILNQGFGNFAENLELINHINFEVSLDISKKVEPTSLNGRGLIFIEDQYVKAQASGTYDSWYILDKFDANGNGLTDDKLATVGNDTYLIINSNTNWLDTDLSISVNNSPYKNETSMLTNANDNIRLKLSIDNIHDGYISSGGFIYNISVPKKDMSSFGFSLELVSFVEETSFFDITYTEDGVNYYSKSQVKDIKNVRGIKIKSIKQIDPNYKYDFIVNMRFEKGSYNKKSLFVNSIVNGSQVYRKGTSSTGMTHKLEPIYIFIKDNTSKPTITAPTQNSFFDSKEKVNVTWKYTDADSSQVVGSVVNIKNSSNKDVEIINIDNSSTFCKISLLDSDIYSVSVTSYNSFGVDCSSDRLLFRFGIHKSDGYVFSKDINISGKIRYIVILANRDVPKGTTISARIYFQTDSSGNISIASSNNGYIDVPLQDLNLANPVPVKMPNSVSKVKVALYLKNATNPLNPKISPNLDYISVLAR